MTKLTNQQFQAIKQMEIALKNKSILEELSSLEAITLSSERKLGYFKPVLVSFSKKFNNAGKSIGTFESSAPNQQDELLIKLGLTEYDLNPDFRKKCYDGMINFLEKSSTSYKTDHLFSNLFVR